MATSKRVGKKVAIGGVQVDPQRAVEMAVKALDNPMVREGLAKASGVVVAWAGKVRHEHQERQEKTKTADPVRDDESPDRFTDRFGQRGLERRVAGLRDAAKEAFASPTDPGRVELEQALDSIDRYLAVAARLPLVKRKRAHWKTDNLLDDLERGLVEAVAPA